MGKKMMISSAATEMPFSIFKSKPEIGVQFIPMAEDFRRAAAFQQPPINLGTGSPGMNICSLLLPPAPRGTLSPPGLSKDMIWNLGIPQG